MGRVKRALEKICKYNGTGIREALPGCRDGTAKFPVDGIAAAVAAAAATSSPRQSRTSRLLMVS